MPSRWRHQFKYPGVFLLFWVLVWRVCVILTLCFLQFSHFPTLLGIQGMLMSVCVCARQFVCCWCVSAIIHISSEASQFLQAWRCCHYSAVIVNHHIFLVATPICFDRMFMKALMRFCTLKEHALHGSSNQFCWHPEDIKWVKARRSSGARAELQFAQLHFTFILTLRKHVYLLLSRPWCSSKTVARPYCLTLWELVQLCFCQFVVSSSPLVFFQIQRKSVAQCWGRTPACWRQREQTLFLWIGD